MANTLTHQDQTFTVGDTVQVFQKIQEDSKTRLQVFEGILMAVRGHGVNQSFRVRKISHAGVGVERIWPTASPQLDHIKLKKRGSVRRAKLYYLRQRLGKEALQTGSITETAPRKPAPKTKTLRPAKKTTSKSK